MSSHRSRRLTASALTLGAAVALSGMAIMPAHAAPNGSACNGKSMSNQSGRTMMNKKSTMGTNKSGMCNGKSGMHKKKSSGM